jgi:hypothetical protein
MAESDHHPVPKAYSRKVAAREAIHGGSSGTCGLEEGKMVRKGEKL